jgi:hypothetical protein
MISTIVAAVFTRERQSVSPGGGDHGNLDFVHGAAPCRFAAFSAMEIRRGLSLRGNAAAADEVPAACRHYPKLLILKRHGNNCIGTPNSGVCQAITSCWGQNGFGSTVLLNSSVSNVPFSAAQTFSMACATPLQREQLNHRDTPKIPSSGDPEGHSEAARRGWEERRGEYRGRGSRNDDDDRGRGRGSRNDDDDRGRRGSDHGGWFGDPRGHSTAARRGWESRR